MNSLTNDNLVNDNDDNDDNDNEVKLWEDLEEKDLLEIPLSSSSSNPLKLSLRQYVSSDIQWDIHSLLDITLVIFCLDYSIADKAYLSNEKSVYWKGEEVFCSCYMFDLVPKAE